MNIDKLEAELIRLIKDSEQHGEPVNKASWQDEQGVLLTRQEALGLVTLIGQLKSLEAAAYGITLQGVLRLVADGMQLQFRPKNDGFIITAMKRDKNKLLRVREAEFTRDILKDGKATDSIFNNIINSL